MNLATFGGLSLGISFALVMSGHILAGVCVFGLAVLLLAGKT